MNKANRAAQFNPFDSLKGLQEALREREEHFTRVEKRELGEEQQNELSRTLNKIERGTVVSVTFYDGGHYIELAGKVTDMNAPYRFAVINNVKIYFDDMYEVKIVK